MLKIKPTILSYEKGNNGKWKRKLEATINSAKNKTDIDEKG